MLFAFKSYAQIKFSKEVLEQPQKEGTHFERKFNSITISKFQPDSFLSVAILENGYSKSTIVNPQAWPIKGKKVKVVEVQIIYTLYPKDKDFWMTNYHQLLAARLKELFKLDSTLTDKKI